MNGLKMEMNLSAHLPISAYRPTSYHYSLATGRGVSEAVLDDSGPVQQIVEAGRRNIPVRDMPYHIVRTAIARNPFFAFKSLKTYFPHIKSVREFIEADEYLGGLLITLQGDERYLLSNETYLAAITGLLQRIASELRQNITEYRGTESFKPSNVNSIFTDKTLVNWLKVAKGRMATSS